MAWDDEYEDLPGLDSKMRNQNDIDVVETYDNDVVGSDTDDGMLGESAFAYDEFGSLPGLDQKTRQGAGIYGDDFGSALDYLLNPNQEEQQTIAPTTIAMPNRIGELQGKVDEATARANTAFQTMQDITKWSMEQDEARAAELKPRFTQEELDSRRAKSTNLSMLTSALANLANGIAVGKGAINATVPDGYQAAYQHWDDVQKKHSARRAEYDKLVDSIYSKKYGMSKAEYDKALKEQGVATAAYENELNRQTRLEQTRMTNERIASTEAAKLAEDARQFDEKNKAGYFKKQPRSGGGGGGSKSSGSLEDYRSYGSVTIPSGVSIPDAYSKMAEKAAAYLEGTKEGKTPTEKAEIDKKIDAIKKKKTMVGTDSEKKAKIKALIEAFDAAGIPANVLQEALDGMQPSQPAPQPTKKNSQSNSNSGNGGKKRINGF